MTYDKNRSLQVENEIDLREIIKIFMESKKLIILTTLIFTIVSIIYSLSLKPEFKSSLILEIGYTEMLDGSQKSVEKPSDLISNLNLYQFLNNQNDDHNTSYEAIENKLIVIETTSKSVEQNENLLTEMISDINERHSNLSLLSINQIKDDISFKIEIIESEISFIKAKELNERQLKQSEIENRIAELKNTLPSIDQEITLLEKIIFDETKNLSLLSETKKLAERAALSPSLDQDIYSYKNKINDLNSKKNILSLETNILHNQLNLLKNDTLQSDQLFSLEQEQKILENQLQMTMAQTQVKTHPIGNIETITIKPKTQLIISLGLFIGFISGIFLVIIRNFAKSYAESQA